MKTEDLKALYHRVTSDETSHPAIVPIRAAIRWISVFYLQLHWDRAFVRSAAMAYTTLIAFVPLLLLIFGALSAAGVMPQDQENIEHILFKTFLGDIPGVRGFLMPGLLAMDLKALSVLGIGGLLFIAARLFLMVERAYNDIFGCKIRRKMVYRLLNFYFTITAVPILACLFLIGVSDAFGPALNQGAYVSIEFLVAFFVLFSALKLFPCTTVQWGPALAGSLVSTVLLTIGRYGFHYYLLWFKLDDPLNVIYGSLALVPIFLIWLYLVWVVVLLGVEIAYVTQNFDSLWQMEREQAFAAANVMHVPDLATPFGVLLQVGAAYEAGLPPPTQEALAKACGVNRKTIYPVLDLLRQSGWIFESDSGWVLACSSAAIEMHEVARIWWEKTTPLGTDADVGIVGLRAELRAGIEGPLKGTLQEGITRWYAEKHRDH